MLFSDIFGFLAAICLLPSLYYGTRQDLREFKFSASHFNTLWVNAAFVLVVLMYIALVAEGLWDVAVGLIVLTILAELVFSFFGFRYESGGDWRVLMYIAAIAPFMLIYVLIASGIFGIAQAVCWVLLKKSDVTPVLFQKIPFALSIFLGYLFALGVYHGLILSAT